MPYQLADIINRVHNADCLEFMRDMPDECVNCVITDPPYNIGKRFGNYADNLPENEYIKWLGDIWKECGRIAKPQSHLVYFNRIAYIPTGMRDIPEPWKFFHLEVWHKPLALAAVWYSIAPHWEPIFIYVHGQSWRKFRDENVWSDVHHHSVCTLRNGHPTIKPLYLMAELIEHYCPNSGIILDPFLGSGTTAVAAKQLGRNFIGIEINPEYCKIAEERLKQEVLPFSKSVSQEKQEPLFSEGAE